MNENLSLLEIAQKLDNVKIEGENLKDLRVIIEECIVNNRGTFQRYITETSLAIICGALADTGFLSNDINNYLLKLITIENGLKILLCKLADEHKNNSNLKQFVISLPSLNNAYVHYTSNLNDIFNELIANGKLIDFQDIEKIVEKIKKWKQITTDIVNKFDVSIENLASDFWDNLDKKVKLLENILSTYFEKSEVEKIITENNTDVFIKKIQTIVDSKNDEFEKQYKAQKSANELIEKKFNEIVTELEKYNQNQMNAKKIMEDAIGKIAPLELNSIENTIVTINKEVENLKNKDMEKLQLEIRDLKEQVKHNNESFAKEKSTKDKIIEKLEATIKELKDESEKQSNVIVKLKTELSNYEITISSLKTQINELTIKSKQAIEFYNLFINSEIWEGFFNAKKIEDKLENKLIILKKGVDDSTIFSSFLDKSNKK